MSIEGIWEFGIGFESTNFFYPTETFYMVSMPGGEKDPAMRVLKWALEKETLN